MNDVFSLEDKQLLEEYAEASGSTILRWVSGLIAESRILACETSGLGLLGIVPDKEVFIFHDQVTMQSLSMSYAGCHPVDGAWLWTQLGSVLEEGRAEYHLMPHFGADFEEFDVSSLSGRERS